MDFPQTCWYINFDTKWLLSQVSILDPKKSRGKKDKDRKAVIGPSENAAILPMMINTGVYGEIL